MDDSPFIKHGYFNITMINFVKFAPSLRAASDFMHNMGKMYVVIAVVALVVIGLFLYLYNLDRKVSKIENEINRKNGK